MAYASIDNLPSMLRSQEYGDDPRFKIPILPSTKLDILRAYDQWQRCADAGADGLVASAKAIQKSYALHRRFSISSMYLGLLMPALESHAGAFDNYELNRRLTYTSLAIKRFQLKNQRWPRNLSELSDVGLTANEWTINNHSPFGYSIEGEQVYLWSHDPNKDPGVSPTKPAIDPDHPDATWYVVKIL